VEKKVTLPEIANKRDNKEITTEVSYFTILGNRREQNPPKCYNCQGAGHMARECPNEKQ
jgi:hypothetical protein